MNYKNISIEELNEYVLKKDGKAICELGDRYRFGLGGVDQNYTKAYNMYHKAEKLNETNAYIALAQMYENGEYFGKNIQLAQEYYKKAGISTSASFEPNNETEHTNNNWNIDNTYNSMSKSSGSIIKVSDLLEKAEISRDSGDYAKAKKLVEDAFLELRNVDENVFEYDKVRANADWIMAFIHFNEQNYNEFEKYISKKNVIDEHPWGAYLVSVVHQMNNSDGSILKKDANRMLSVLNNPNLSASQLGDILTQLGDFSLLEIVDSNVNNIEQAYDFYKSAADEGNEYAIEQLGKFKKNILGKMQYGGD